MANYLCVLCVGVCVWVSACDCMCVRLCVCVAVCEVAVNQWQTALSSRVSPVVAAAICVARVAYVQITHTYTIYICIFICVHVPPYVFADRSVCGYRRMTICKYVFNWFVIIIVAVAHCFAPLLFFDLLLSLLFLILLLLQATNISAIPILLLFV